MRRVLTIGTKRLEIFRRSDLRPTDNPINFKDAAEARQYLRILARDPNTMTTLRRVMAGVPGIAAAGATDAQILTWLSERLHRKQIYLVDKGIAHGPAVAADEEKEEKQEAPKPEPVKKKIFDLKLISVTPHFAPGEFIYINGDTSNQSAGETCSIQYQVIDPDATATKGTLEILRKNGGAVLHKVDLTKAQYSHGKHSFEWDGKCSAGPSTYPYAHLLHSPYTVRVTVNGLSEKKVTGETAVLLEELIIQRGHYRIDEIEPAADSDAYYQYRLTQMGYHVGAVDGDVGSNSQRAIRNFQRSTGYLRVNGRLDKYTKACIDHTAPSGTGTDHYQWILNYVGFRCGRCDGSIGDKTRRAIRRYKTVRGIAPINDTLDATTKGRLDGEALAAMPKRVILEGDDAHNDVSKNPFPATGATKKCWVDGDSCWSPDFMPAGKWNREQSRLIRPSFPVIARPLVKTKAGGKAHAPQGTGKVRVEFSVATTAPPADLGVPNTTARAFVQRVLNLDGGNAATGHHLHQLRGGVRTATDPGVFRTGKSLKPYDVSRSGTVFRCDCDLFWNERQGTAGVFFRPSTIGGDRFALVAKIANNGFDTPPAAEVKAETGNFIIWRRYRIAKRWLMGYVNQPHDCQVAKLGIQPWYEPCFLEFVDVAAPNPTMLVSGVPANQATRTGGDEIVDLEIYRTVLRAAGYRPAALPDAQINARYADTGLYALTPATAWTGNWGNYHGGVDTEIFRFEVRFMRALRDLSNLEAPEGVVTLIINRNAPLPGTLNIPPVPPPLPGGAGGWWWSIFPTERTVMLLQNADDFLVTAPVSQTGVLANAETLTFANTGEFFGIPVANRRITFAAGSTQAQVEAAIDAHATIGQHVDADTVDLDAANAASPEWVSLRARCDFTVTSDQAAAANSTGLGNAALVAASRRAVAGTSQTAALTAQEVLQFTERGVFQGVTAAASRRITLAAGLTQAQVVAAINAHANIGPRILASVHNGNLVLTAKGQYTVTSSQAQGATSTGVGTQSIREGGAGETMAHEVGHALYMRHASTTNGQNADNEDEHNQVEWQDCNMSYINMDHFCGKCVLKLRGCNETTLHAL